MTLHDHPDASTNAEQTRPEDEPLRFVVGRDDAWHFKTADEVVVRQSNAADRVDDADRSESRRFIAVDKIESLADDLDALAEVVESDNVASADSGSHADGVADAYEEVAAELRRHVRGESDES